MSDWEGVRLHVVTGKGGTGKTTVAAALALALARGGKKVLLVEVEGRQGIAQLFDQSPLPYQERKVAVAPEGGDVFALAISPREAMAEYLAMYYHLGRAGRALDRFGAVDFASTVAPGMRDVLITGKTYEAVRRTNRTGQRVYDAVVMDAPPTGRIVRFLSVNHEVAGLARIGPIHRHAESIMRLLQSPETVVHLVTLLEEMPVQETIDGVAELRAAKLPVGGVFINQVRRSDLKSTDLTAAKRGRLNRETIEAGLTSAGLRTSTALIDALISEAGEHADRAALQKQEREALAELERPTYELPRIPEGIDLGALYELADELHEQDAS